MCGRYTLICIDDLGLRFRIHDPSLGFRSHFNVAPSDMMPVIVRQERTEAVTMQWGLISHLAKDAKGAPHPFNARVETIADRPLFSSLLARNRCLVPASGFYEWKREGRRNVPYYITLKECPLFAFAGLYDVWYDAAGTLCPRYTIITTKANELVSTLHDRMPAILKREDEEKWLSGESPGKEALGRILAPYPAGEMTAYPVSNRVNTAGAEDDERLIRPVATLG
jgi:putative SOS response-associated peptidase YedK